MTKHSILFTGLDTHFDCIVAAYVEEHRGREMIHHRQVSSAKDKVDKLARQLRLCPFALCHS
jgi:hypothetical protein